MTNDNLVDIQASDPQPVPFGARLQSAREALGLERKDAAAQLRLNEKVITMLEKDKYSPDLPDTFIRGYIRAYGKLLQIPDYEIKMAIEPIKPKPLPQPVITPKEEPLTTGNYSIQLITGAILFILLGLVGMWWHSHSSTPAATTNQTLALPDVPAATAPQPPVAIAPPTPAPSATPAPGENKAAVVAAPTPTDTAKPNAGTTATNSNTADDDDAADDDSDNDDDGE